MERQFKAFQPVLVRNGITAHWKTALYSNYNAKLGKHFCDNQPWNFVVAHDETTEHLIGTTQEYTTSEKTNDMKELENFINQCLPKASEEDMVVAIGVLITEANEDSKRMAIKDPLHQQAEETYVNLHRDAYRYNLHIDLADFELEHPEMNVFEIDRHFRNEWDI